MIGTGAAILGSGLLSTVGSMLGSRSKKSTSIPTLPPELQAMFDKNSGFLSGVRDDPSAGLAPIRRATTERVNRTFSRLPQIATAKLASRGFGGSGKVGSSIYDMEGSRLSTLGGIESDFGKMGSDRQMNAVQIMQQMLSSRLGTTQTAPGNMAGNALMTGGNALSNLVVLQTLSKMLNNGGAPAWGEAGSSSTASNGWYDPGGGGYEGTGWGGVS